MNKFVKNGILILLVWAFLPAYAQHNSPVLFTDRDYCVSGDTVWFKVGFPETCNTIGNVVHVQLQTLNKSNISVVAKKTENNWAEGYLRIPDSLSTGLYFLSSFLNVQRENKTVHIKSKSLIVYNRFEANISQINTVNLKPDQKTHDLSSLIQINSDKTKYRPRETVSLTIGLDKSVSFKNAVIKASLIDPLAAEVGGDYQFQYHSAESSIPPFIETDGILVNGKVFDANGINQEGALVILSITDEPPYLDYYLTGEEGDFHFYLKNAVGRAKIVLQVVSSKNEEFFIHLSENYLIRSGELSGSSKLLTAEQVEFSEKIIQANYMNKIFNPILNSRADTFAFPPRFSVPFYGEPTRRVVPDEFINLPDFREISRELLPGVQYRIRNDQVIFRMINTKQNTFFNDEPLKLLNGIPIFKNSLLSNLKSLDISYIDIVQSERIFGDLRMNGILSVSLYDKSNLWINQISGITEFTINCLQPDKSPGYVQHRDESINLPDFRQNYLWERTDNEELQNYSFYLSDLKGKIEISVEGFDDENNIFKASKIIEVE